MLGIKNRVRVFSYPLWVVLLRILQVHCLIGHAMILLLNCSTDLGDLRFVHVRLKLKILLTHLIDLVIRKIS